MNVDRRTFVKALSSIFLAGGLPIKDMLPEAYKIALKVGESVRASHGDLSALKESIAKVGVLEPILILATGELISGFRRIAACREMGIKEIPAKIFGTLDEKGIITVDL